VTDGWAVRVPKSESHSIAKLRAVDGLLICEQADNVWLRGDNLDEELTVRLRALPRATRFSVLPDWQLVEFGQRVPRGMLPDGKWKALTDWAHVELPSICWPGELQERVPIRLVRSRFVSDARALQTTIAELLAWTGAAPRVRLDPLRFAMCRDGRVLIHGWPLPPLRGRRLTFSEGIAAPAGWTWSPGIDAEVLRDACRLAPGDVALLWPDATWELIESEQFARVTRSAVRAAAEVDVDG
jgi:hypothetical protein